MGNHEGFTIRVGKIQEVNIDERAKAMAEKIEALYVSVKLL